MNLTQVLRQMKDRIGARTWDDSGAVVVGVPGAVVSVLQPEELIGSIVPPFCVIAPGATIPDAERGDLWRQRFDLTIVQQQEGDEIGEAIWIGGHIGDNTVSEGRGIFEIESEILSAVGYETAASGTPRFTLIHGGAGLPTFISRTGHGLRKITIETTVTRDRTYPAPTRLALSEAGGTVTLTWNKPPSRFDFFRINIRRGTNSSDPAPSTVSGGTAVFTGDAETTTDAPGAGTWAYAAFAEYDETGTYDEGTAATAERQSDQETGSTASITF